MTTTPQRTIPGFATIGENVDQWTIETMQMVNWGGFHGHRSVTFDVDATLLTGASGTGKSTLLDAYIALMMDSNAPFNNASNDNTIGRARGADQRNPLSYVRGQYNTSRDPVTGQPRPDVLRGDGTNTWSAIAVTWINDNGTRFTGMRFYYAPASARRSTEMRFHMATYPGRFDLRTVEPFAGGNFHHGRMATRFPGIAFHDSYAKFSAVLHKKLAIGSHGDGSQAIKLLARIQGGKQVASVDNLYKEMVLERPRTYEAADKAVEHFGNLEASYDQMRTVEQQIDTLRPIPDAHAALRRAETEVDLIDTFHVTEPPEADTPLAVWAHRTEADLLADEIAANRGAHQSATDQQRTSRKATTDLEAELAHNQQAQRDNGGDALEKVERDLKQLVLALSETQAARTLFADRVKVIGDAPDTLDEHTAMRAAAGVYLAEYPALLTRAQERLEALGDERFPLRTEQNDLMGERSYLRARSDLIPQSLSEARAAIAAQVGVDPADLPFVAELLDMDPEHEQWREAAELVLGGFARTLLVDRTHGRDFRRNLNALRLSQRIQFTIADTHTPTRALDEAALPGRFIFKDQTPFIGWLQSQLAHRFDYACILDASGFADDKTRRVTLTGQTQDGDRGAHGGHGARRIIGFSNTRRLADIDARLVEVDDLLADVKVRHDQATTERAALDTLRGAHQHVLDTGWDKIDTATVSDKITGKENERARLLADSDILATLKTREGAIAIELDGTRRALTLAEEAIKVLNTEWADLCSREDAVNDRLYGLDENTALTLTADQQTRLDTEYGKAAVTRTHAEFKAVLAKVRIALGTQVAQARTEVATHTTALTAAFAAYQRQWPQPNLGIGVDSYTGYREILDLLLVDGIASYKDQFKQKVIDWSGEDLLGLHRSFDDAVDEIDERLVPVNDILATLPFGRAQERLNITLTHQRGDDIKQFRTELRTLASNTMLLVTDTDVEARFKQLQRFITRIRKADATAARDHLLDVRRHVHVEAVTLDPNDPTAPPTAVFNTLGNKSGGETQELIAFIVGAALRYQLGADRGRPTYAPVFLDEGFVKADSQFAGRAVSAWLGLGFQLIVGAPLDKVGAIEPFMNQMLMVTKNAQGLSRIDNVTPDTDNSNTGDSSVVAANAIDEDRAVR